MHISQPFRVDIPHQITAQLLTLLPPLSRNGFDENNMLKSLNVAEKGLEQNLTFSTHPPSIYAL